MTQKILVLGSTGTIGKELVKVLSQRQAHFVAGLRDAARKSVFDSASIDTVVVDYQDGQFLLSVLEDIDVLFLLLPPMDTEAGIAIGHKIIDLAKNQNLKHIVLLSAMHAEKDSGGYHLPIEQHLKQSQVPYTILQPNFFMQNFCNYFVADINRKNRINIFDANTKTSFIDARDIAEVAAEVLINNDQHRNKTYTLTGLESLNHHDVTDLFTQQLGREIQYTAQSDDDTVTSLRDSGWPEDAIKKFIRIYQLVQQGVYAEITDDVTMILKRPAISFKTFIEDYKGCFNESHQ